MEKKKVPVNFYVFEKNHLIDTLRNNGRKILTLFLVTREYYAQILHIITTLKNYNDDHSNVIQQTRIKYPRQSLCDLAKKGCYSF